MSKLTLNDPISEINEKIEQALKQEAESLSLANLCLRKLPSSLFSLHSVRNLDLSENPLVELPIELTALKSLETLTVNDCGLIEIPAWVGDCPSLKKLTLSMNFIPELGLEHSQLQNIEELDLSHNLLVEIPDWMPELESLTEFDISFNYIIDIPENILTWLQDRHAKYDEVYRGIPKKNSVRSLQKAIIELRESIGEREIPKLKRLFDRYEHATCSEMMRLSDSTCTQVEKEISAKLEPLITALPESWRNTGNKARKEMDNRWSTAKSEIKIKTNEHKNNLSQIRREFSTYINEQKSEDVKEISILIDGDPSKIKLYKQKRQKKIGEWCIDSKNKCENYDEDYKLCGNRLHKETCDEDAKQEQQLKTSGEEKNDTFSRTSNTTIGKIIEPVKLQVLNERKVTIQYLTVRLEVVASCWKFLSASLKKHKNVIGTKVSAFFDLLPFPFPDLNLFPFAKYHDSNQPPVHRLFWVNKKDPRKKIEEIRIEANSHLYSFFNNTTERINDLKRQYLPEIDQRYKSANENELNDVLDLLKKSQAEKERDFNSRFDRNVKDATIEAIDKSKSNWEKFINSLESEVTLENAYNNLWDYLSEDESVYIHRLSPMERLAAEIMVQEGWVNVHVDIKGWRKLETRWNLQAVVRSIPSFEELLESDQSFQWLLRRLRGRFRLIRSIFLPFWTWAFFILEVMEVKFFGPNQKG